VSTGKATKIDKPYIAGRNFYWGTTIPALDISGSGHIGETIIDIMVRDVSESGKKQTNQDTTYRGNKSGHIGNDMSGKYLDKSEVENIILKYENRIF
jgi:hypothetical protein